MRVLAFIAAVSVLLSTSFVPAFADDGCHPLTLFASVDLSRRNGDTRMYVPVSLNGTQKLMLLDTGGFMSEVTPQAVAELNLQHESVDFESVNVAGEESHLAANVSSFAIGQLTTKSVQFIIAPEHDMFAGDARFAGILAPNVLRFYDVDIDFGAQKLNLISPDHCEGKVVYWPAAAVAVVPIRVLKWGHISLPVQLDGKTVNAILDTGASMTTLTQTAAESDFGLKMGSKDAPYAQELQDKPGAAIYHHRFASLDFGGIAVGNLDVALLPDYRDKLAQAPSLGSRLGNPKDAAEYEDMLLGMNVLRHLHIYIAYKEQKLYITPAGAPQTASSASTGGGNAAGTISTAH